MKTAVDQIGKSPVVILPMEEYERMKEDLEMLKSRNLAGKIKKARANVARGKIYTLSDVKKALNLA